MLTIQICHSNINKIRLLIQAVIKTKNKMKNKLEEIANDLLNQTDNKPNYSNRDFMNATIIFQTALMDKMYDNQEYDNMSINDRMNMAESCGLALRKLIHTYTGLDTHKIEEFI